MTPQRRGPILIRGPLLVVPYSPPTVVPMLVWQVAKLVLSKNQLRFH